MIAVALRGGNSSRSGRRPCVRAAPAALVSRCPLEVASRGARHLVTGAAPAALVLRCLSRCPSRGALSRHIVTGSRCGSRWLKVPGSRCQTPRYGHLVTGTTPAVAQCVGSSIGAVGALSKCQTPHYRDTDTSFLHASGSSRVNEVRTEAPAPSLLESGGHFVSEHSVRSPIGLSHRLVGRRAWRIGAKSSCPVTWRLRPPRGAEPTSERVSTR